MLTESDKNLIEVMVKNSKSGKMVKVGIDTDQSPAGSSLQISEFASILLHHQHQQYKRIHNTKIRLAEFVHKLCKEFTKANPYNLTEAEKAQLDLDIMFAMQKCKKILQSCIPDARIKNQSDTMISLVSLSMVYPITPDKKPVRAIIPDNLTIEDLFEEPSTKALRLDIPEGKRPSPSNAPPVDDHQSIIPPVEKINIPQRKGDTL
jgi:hypothetical protein